MARRFRKKSGKARGKPEIRPVSGIYLPNHEREVTAIAMRGATDQDIARTFGIQYSLFKKWKKTYPSFKDAIEKGRTKADTEVMHALYKRATGKFSIPQTEIVKYQDRFETVDIQKHYPPDIDSIKFWLNNRQKEHWQTRSAVEQSGPGGKPIEITANRSELLDAIVNMVQPKPDGEVDKLGTPKRPKRPKSSSTKKKA